MYPSASLWLLLTLLATIQAANNPEVSWGDWIIVDETEPGTSILLRRITPKSVFVAPTFNGCSEGYRQDSLGRCVKLVKVNQQAQWNFFLERLNSMYAPSSTSKNPQKEAGPFHISLPIGSESSQEEVIVKKRIPPIIRDEVVKTTQSTSSQPAETTTQVLPTTSKTMHESTLPEVTHPTVLENSEVKNTEKEFNFETDSTTETRKDATTESFLDDAVMLGDQPVSSEDLAEAESLITPKNYRENTSQLPEKPFVIIVTNEPTTRTEDISNVPSTTSFTLLTTEGEGEEDTSETPSTTEVTTEGTTETTSRYTTECTPKTTEYEESVSEIKDTTETSIRPSVKHSSPPVIRPKCDPIDSQDRDDCEPIEMDVISDERVVTNRSVSLPASLPLHEPNTQIKFPSDSFVPVQKTQSFVRFPEETNPHEDRPSFWWPTWQIQQHPDIRGWPSSEDEPSEEETHKQYPPYSWSDSSTWRRRFFQRD